MIHKIFTIYNIKYIWVKIIPKAFEKLENKNQFSFEDFQLHAIFCYVHVIIKFTRFR